jgi:dTDP-4-dehydrorhamnose reductase
MSNAIILGASGLVGSALLQTAPAKLHVSGTTFSQTYANLTHLDIRNRAAVEQILRDAQIVLMPAAFPNVDACERDPEGTRAINVTGVAHVVDVCAANGATLVYYSSDYVFDGQKGNYAESDTPNPICEYGRQKLEAENLVATLRHHLILRTTWVVGLEQLGKNFVYRTVQTLRRGDMLTVPNDQFGQPTSSLDLGRASWELVQRHANGVFHVAGQTLLSRLEFAQLIAEVFGLSITTLRSVSTDQLRQAAPRPLRGGLDSSQAAILLGWRLSHARDVLESLYGAL